MKKQIGNQTELLDEVRKSLQAVVHETATAYEQAETEEGLENDDYETLAHAYLTFRQWAVDWLKRVEG
ncbi:MAG: hypothetical protein FWE95_11175 [Planctomycetaceae bacterium]|nr:hypothetical protein [Planctomycetaceae bacterium]